MHTVVKMQLKRPVVIGRAIAAALLLTLSLVTPPLSAAQGESGGKRLAYLVSDLRIPFWAIMQKGIEQRAQALGYQLETYSARNDAKSELEAVNQAIEHQVDGIILSPTNSSAAVTILKIAAKAGIPVVISDIGSDDGEYVSYIESDNEKGAYELGQVLARALRERDWTDGSIGIIAIPQRRANGQARTKGFMKALDEAGLKAAGLYQQSDFSYRETYDFSRTLIAENPEMRAIWLQGSDRYQAALDAIHDANKTGEILLICFDAEPEFIDMIRRGDLVGAGMQQPLLMGQTAVDNLHAHLQGDTTADRVLVPVLPVSRYNIESLATVIQRNVLGLDAE